jgi:hypothetical protein
METGNLLSDLIFLAAIAVPGGLLVVLALMTAFVVVGQALLMVRRIQASRVKGARGHTHAARSATSDAAVVID